MSRGLKNCNPGNIRRSLTRYKGEVESRDADFKCFAALAWGYRAVFVLLHTYRVRYGIDTISGMIGRYAPSCENDTRNYIRLVERLSGIPASRQVNTLLAADMVPIVEAISRVENGVPADRKHLERGWELFFEDFGRDNAGR